MRCAVRRQIERADKDKDGVLSLKEFMVITYMFLDWYISWYWWRKCAHDFFFNLSIYDWYNNLFRVLLKRTRRRCSGVFVDRNQHTNLQNLHPCFSNRISARPWPPCQTVCSRKWWPWPWKIVVSSRRTTADSWVNYLIFLWSISLLFNVLLWYSMILY